MNAAVPSPPLALGPKWIEADFLIETYSDYIIDRYRQKLSARNKVRKSEGESSHAQVLFFDSRKGVNSTTPIPILPSGGYSPDQPANFKKFFFDEELKNLKI